MGIDEVQSYRDRLQATSQAIQAVAPERVAAKDAFIVLYQTLALTHKMFHEYKHAFDVDFFRTLRETLGEDLINFLTALGSEGISSSSAASTDLQAANMRGLTGEEREAVVNGVLDDINREVRALRRNLQKVIRELERQAIDKHATESTTSEGSSTYSPLINFGSFTPGELSSALQGLLSKETLEDALAGSAPGVSLPLGDVQRAVTVLLLALQSQVAKRSNIVAVQQVNQALPNANLQDPKLGLFVDTLALEGILGLNESGLIPDLLSTLLQNTIPQLTPEELENVVQALSPLLSQALLQLNTARVLSYFPDDLKAHYIKLLQSIQQQAEGTVPSAQAASPPALPPSPIEAVDTADVLALKQETAAFAAEAFPTLAAKQLGQLVDRVVSVLFGPTSVPSKDASSFKRTVKGAPAATPTPSTPPLLSSAHFQEFQHQLKFPKPLKEILAEDAHRQVAETEALRQAQLHQINRAFQDEAQQVADAVAAQDLNTDQRKGLARDVDRSLSKLGEDLLSNQLATKEQQRSDLADAFRNLNSRAGQLADKIYLLTTLANLQRVKEPDRKQALRSELKAPLTASLALSLQNAGVANAQSLAEQVAQAVTGPDFAVSVLKKLQQPPPVVATALAEAKAEAAVTHERKKVAEVLPSVIDSLVKLSNRDRENRRRDNIVSDIRAEARDRSPRNKETNYLSAFLDNQLNPAVKYERRGGIQEPLMVYYSQVEKEIKANPGMV